MSAMRPVPIRPAPGQESAWDTRPPRFEPTAQRIHVVFAGVKIANTIDAWRVLATSHPPVYCLPPADVRCDLLVPRSCASSLEGKGRAAYWSVVVGDQQAPDAVYGYPAPTAKFWGNPRVLCFLCGQMEAY